ncbi:MAG TPA: hypothetical protein VN345_14445, partial [Blastocatellia bacterium]|nr:hypothetical protein [Blastocatellia bacterium]
EILARPRSKLEQIMDSASKGGGPCRLYQLTELAILASIMLEGFAPGRVGIAADNVAGTR